VITPRNHWDRGDGNQNGRGGQAKRGETCWGLSKTVLRTSRVHLLLQKKGVGKTKGSMGGKEGTGGKKGKQTMRGQD